MKKFVFENPSKWEGNLKKNQLYTDGIDSLCGDLTQLFAKFAVLFSMLLNLLLLQTSFRLGLIVHNPRSAQLLGFLTEKGEKTRKELNVLSNIEPFFT